MGEYENRVNLTQLYITFISVVGAMQCYVARDNKIWKWTLFTNAENTLVLK